MQKETVTSFTIFWDRNGLTPVIGVWAGLSKVSDYTVTTLRLGADILRDSVLTRLENLHYEAYVHVNAIMWKVAFEELRALINKKTFKL